MYQEQAVTFSCGGETLVGILHLPQCPAPNGVVIVPGAPQYRVGSHRQLVLLARDLAAQGTAVLRFDYRGMGDSDGTFRPFDQVADDLAAAISELMKRVPDLKAVCLWGFCDGASASCFYASSDARVEGIVLVNPWVRDLTTTDQALVRHYYLDQLKSRAFWGRLLTGKIAFWRTATDVLGRLWRLSRNRKVQGAPRRSGVLGAADGGPLCERVSRALTAYDRRVLLFLSGADLTAQEFKVSVLETTLVKQWQQNGNLRIVRLEGANHTYSKPHWRRLVHEATVQWLQEGLTQR